MSPRDITSRRFGRTILSKLVQKSGSDINKQHAAARHDIGQNARWIIVLDDMIVEMASRRLPLAWQRLENKSVVMLVEGRKSLGTIQGTKMGPFSAKFCGIVHPNHPEFDLWGLS
jgi:hypothetical protein